MATTGESKSQVRHGQTSSMSSLKMQTSRMTSSSKHLESLASQASQVLQQHDEWMSQCEESNYMDTGDALNQLARLRSMCERILEAEGM